MLRWTTSYKSLYFVHRASSWCLCLQECGKGLYETGWKTINLKEIKISLHGKPHAACDFLILLVMEGGLHNENKWETSESINKQN